MISVTNLISNTNIEVAVNRWGKDGNTDFFNIETEKTETWDRSDERGFVMSLKIDSTQKSYFVLHNSVIVVTRNKGLLTVKDKGVPIKPCRS